MVVRAGSKSRLNPRQRPLLGPVLGAFALSTFTLFTGLSDVMLSQAHAQQNPQPAATAAAVLPTPPSSDETIKQTEDLLNRLEDQEASLLGGSKGKPPTDDSSLVKRLQEEKRALEAQQENLVNEVIKLKQRLKSAPQNAEPLPGLDSERRAQELARELTREQTRARQLELEMDQMKKVAAEPAPLKVDPKLQRELEAERRRNQNLEAELEAVKQQLGPRAASQKELEQLQQKIAAGDTLAKQLERELESRKKVVADNNFLRAEVEKLQGQLADAQGRSGDAARSASQLAELEKSLKNSLAEQQKLEAKLAETNNKNAADRAKLADIFSKMKADLETARAEGAAAAKTAEQLKDQLSSKAKAEELLAERTLELGRVQKELTAVQEAVETSKKSANDLDASLAELRTSLANEQQEKAKVNASLEAAQVEGTKRNAELEELKRQLAKSVEEVRTFSAAAEAKAKEAAQIPELQAQIAALNGELGKRDAEIKKIAGEKAEKEQFLADLSRGQRECMKEKNELLMAREECRLLTKGSPAATAQRQPTPSSAELAAQRDQIFRDAGSQAGRQADSGAAAARVEPSTDGVMYVEVTADKAKVRTLPDVGRGAEVMSASKGMQLTVEKREGDWYAVITPTGERGWILDNLVKLAPNANVPGITRPRALFGDGEESAAKSPAKPPKRNGAAEGDLEPFGDVSEKTPPKRNDFDRAFDKLKSLGNR